VFEAQMQHESANKQARGYDADGVDNNDGDVGGVENFDNLEEMLWAIGSEILQ
jgi:hypothetical protein